MITKLFALIGDSQPHTAAGSDMTLLSAFVRLQNTTKNCSKVRKTDATVAPIESTYIHDFAIHLYAMFCSIYRRLTGIPMSNYGPQFDIVPRLK